MKRISRTPKVGFALGGGAARGLAHLGVIEVLQREGIMPDVMVGTSFGALAGGTWLAHGCRTKEVIKGIVDYVAGEDFRTSQISFFRRKKTIEKTGFLYSLRDLIKRGIYYGYARTHGSFIAPDEFRRSIEAIVPEQRIEDLPIPFGAVAADIGTGEELVIDQGSLRTAVRASCAIPGIMPPIDVGGGHVCIDGGWVNKVPAETALSMGADVVIAIDVSNELADTVDLTTGLNVIQRGDSIMAHRLKTVQLTRADVVIQCRLEDVDWADFPRAAEIIERGREAGEAALPEVRELLGRNHGLGSGLRRFLERRVRGVGIVRRRRHVVRRSALR
jgi:NTE family protein